MSARRKEEKSEPKRVNVNIFLFVTRIIFTVSIAFHVSFQVVGEIFFPVYIGGTKHQNTKDKFQHQYFLEISIDSVRTLYRSTKKDKNVEPSYNFGWNRNERLLINNKDRGEVQCPFHDQWKF